MHAQSNHHLKAQGEGSHVRAKEEASGETTPATPLVLDFQPPELGEIPFLFLEMPPSL